VFLPSLVGPLKREGSFLYLVPLKFKEEDYESHM